MNSIKKLGAALTAFSVAATMASCSAPTIGGGSATAVTIDGYDIPAGVFIFYSLSAYLEASDIIAEGSETNATPTMEEVEDSHIDNLTAKEWIQNKATDYCSEFVAVEREFEKIQGELTPEDYEIVESQVAQMDQVDIYTKNGISDESASAIFENERKRTHVFEYYYGFEGEKGMSEEELKDYFDENFARVKYVTMSYLDAEGNELSEADKKEVRELAEEYADRINEEKDTMEKLYIVNEVKEEYSEYVKEKAEELAAKTGTVTTTTTTTTTTNATETTTTTTTDPYENESVVSKYTTTTPEKVEDPATTTTTTLSAKQKSDIRLNEFIFEELTDYNKAVVLDDEENDALYVVIRSDLRERMTEEDLWSEDYISALQSLEYSEEFVEYIQELAKSYTAERNKSAYRRYSPFKLDMEQDKAYTY